MFFLDLIFSRSNENPNLSYRWGYTLHQQRNSSQCDLSLSMCRKILTLMNSEVQYIRESERCYFFIVLETPQHGLGSKSTDHLIPYQESQRWWSTNAIQSNNKSPFLGSNVSIEWFSWLNGCQRHSLYLKRTIVCPLTHVVLIILYVISISVRYGL